MENDLHWLSEDLISIQKRCEIALLLIEQQRFHLLPTVLEDNYLVMQQILDIHCVIDNKGIML